MFNNIGNKIKTLAKVMCCIGIASSCFIGLVMIGSAISISNGRNADDVISGYVSGILIAGIGSLCSWIGSFALYGFGELIQSNHNMEQNLFLLTEKFIYQENKTSYSDNDSSDAEELTERIFCANCNRDITDDLIEYPKLKICPYCDKRILFNKDEN